MLGCCCYFWYYLLFLFLLIWLIWYQMSRVSSTMSSVTRIPVRSMIILGSGGHTKEILSLSEALSPAIYSPRIYISSSSDPLSNVKAVEMENRRSKTDYVTMSIARSREVGQSWVTSVFTTGISMIHAVVIVLSVRPEFILCNGPGVCVPICIMAFLAKKLGIFQSKVVYVESICRINSLSFSGKILRYFVDRFFVQWKPLATTYSGTEFIGRLS